MKEFKNRRLYTVSLGCAKNRVDSEKALAILENQGCTVEENPAAADLILVNSCGFIGEARRETIDTILELAEYKKKNPRIKLAVMGCMVERFREEMAKELPEVDYLFTLSDDAMSEIYRSKNTTRVVQPGSVWAYLKIAEGCGNSCSFCSIPMIRGPLKSRPVDEIEAEAIRLMDSGVKELVLVAQDTTRYGADLKMKDGAVKLLSKLAKLGPERLRLMYAYPTLVTDSLIDFIADEPAVCRYMDIPFQHIDDSVLEAMGRRERGDDIKRLVDKVRQKMPDGAIRSSFIVGFPGETEENFRNLEKFIKESALDHVGVFVYSREDGTGAAGLPDDVAPEIKEERRARLMEIQNAVSLEINRSKIGKTYPVLVDRFDDEESLLLGRLETQAPEVDGEVILDNCDANPGDVITVMIEDCMEYDLVGTPV